ncbi:MAG: pyridoxamine 5'-phosphate oxidase family protein, partial [Halobacteriales archaeon]
PTLYLDRDETDGHFCSLIFGDADETAYRIVQLKDEQSFTTLAEALDAQLTDLPDPTEAAAVILTPRATDAEVLSAEVGTETTLHGFRADPEDLTGVSIAFSKLLQRWERQTGAIDVCLRGIESLFPYHDTDLLYRFLNTILATLQGAGAGVHMHMNPAATDEETVTLFGSLFTRTERRDATDEATGGPVASAAEPSSGLPDGLPVDGTLSSTGTAERTATMSDDEIDATLEETGLGVLAFGGESPYAIPMSFGYDADRREIYLQLGAFEGSEKLVRLRESSDVSLVVSEYERPDRWRSVVVDGYLAPLSETDRERRNAVSAFGRAELASVDVFSMDPDDVTFSWYRLSPSSISGRKSATL